MHEDAHHVLWAQFVLVGKLAEVACGIDQQNLVVSFLRALLL
jgi:hypothetical protein